jgi:hypothetical protein
MVFRTGFYSQYRIFCTTGSVEIQYEVRELDSAEVEYELDAYEEYDLYMKNVLVEEEEQVDLVPIEEAIQAFEENVR